MEWGHSLMPNFVLVS